MTNKDFIVKVLKSKTNAKHIDATKPQIAAKPGANGQLGEFFQVSLLAKRDSAKVVEGKKKIFNIWNTGQRALIFDEIKNALAIPANYELDADKNVCLKDSAIYFAGELQTEKTPFTYTMVDADGKPLINSRTKLPQTRKFVQMFIFDFEMENGTGEVLLAGEVDRARRSIVEGSTVGEEIVVEEP